MARLVPVRLRVLVAGLGFMLGCGVALRAETPMLPAAAATNSPNAKPVAPPTPAAKPATTNAAPTLPPAMQDTLGRYGNILTPGDQVTYPLKLKLPFPNDVEVHVPKQEDMVKRQKLEELAGLSDGDLRTQLEAWPAFGKMSLRDQGMMLQRIQDFRDYHARVAQQKAHQMGLLTLNPDQKAKFEKDYWDKRLKMDQDLARQFQPIYQAREQKMDDELFREFSSTAPAPPAGSPPAKPPTAPPKPPAPAPVKSVASNAVPAVTNAAPIAQNPH